MLKLDVISFLLDLFIQISGQSSLLSNIILYVFMFLQYDLTMSRLILFFLAIILVVSIVPGETKVCGV